jgi:hypothetical protein
MIYLAELSDQTDLTSSLRVLPVNIQACEKVLVLCGETYCNRLWCVWELYVVFVFAPKEQAAARVQLQALEEKAPRSTSHAGVLLKQADVPQQLAQFKCEDARCYDPNEQSKILRIIHEGSKSQFEGLIREIGASIGSMQSSSNLKQHLRRFMLLRRFNIK